MVKGGKRLGRSGLGQRKSIWGPGDLPKGESVGALGGIGGLAKGKAVGVLRAVGIWRREKALGALGTR